MKLLIFTEHKDALDYPSGDEQDGRPQGTRIFAGRKFRKVTTNPSVLLAGRCIWIAVRRQDSGSRNQICGGTVLKDIGSR